MTRNLNGAWQARKLNELGFVGRGKSRHRPRNAPELYGGPYPFVQTADIMASEFYITSYSKTYSEAGLAQSKTWEPNTLCMTIAGENTAETAILSFQACFPDSVVGFIADPTKSDVRFVKYYLDYIKPQIRQITRGATQDNLSLDKLLTFDIVAPPVRLQAKIAAVAATYDELILNNSRRIAILEEMAQAIYREWFVHFRLPGHEKVKRINSPLGKIPEGWNTTNLFDVAEVAYGFPYKSKQFTTDPVGKPVIRIRDILGHKSDTNTAEDAGSKYVVRNGDILIGMDGDFHMCRWAGGEAVLNQRVTRLRTKGQLPQYVLFHCVKGPISHFNATIVGTTVAHLGDKHLREINVLLPPPQIQRELHICFEPLFLEEINLRKKNELLRKTRDLLLPKLISGQLDVEELDIETGEPLVEAVA